MIILPDWPHPAQAEPYFLDSGSWQIPSIGGGAALRINRLGDRHGLNVTMPEMKFNDPAGLAHARVWISRLKRGVAEGVRMRFPQPDYEIALPNLVCGVAPANATLLPFTGGTPGLVIPEGVFCSITDASQGKIFLHSVNSQLTIDGSGNGTLSLHPRLRTGLGASDTISFSPPVIEGRLIGEERQWSLSQARTVGLSFQIEEIE